MSYEIATIYKEVPIDTDFEKIKYKGIDALKYIEILEELETIMSIHEEVNEETFNNFYIGLIIEFTDIIMDKDDITFMLKEGNLTSKILMQEINDMIYELQYESAMNNLANVRTMSLGMLTQEALKSMKYTELRIAKENERVERLVKHKVKKPSRRFVK